MYRQIASCFLLTGTRPGRWIWLEAGARWRLSSFVSRHILLGFDRQRLPRYCGHTLRYYPDNCWWTVHRVCDFFIFILTILWNFFRTASSNSVNCSIRRGSLVTTAIFVYAATSPINGYFGGSLYARMGGKRWIRQMLISAFIVPSVVCGTEFFINFIAMYYHASRAIPFSSMVSI